MKPLAALLLVLFWPLATAAASPGAGIVTGVSGRVTVSRTTTPPLPLHFKDEVFLKDRITTAERSLARLLLGKKALVTVRELSELEIRDEAGRSIVDVDSGKIAISVARQRMRSGEVVEVRTQNAVAAIRGTVVVAENIPVRSGAPPVSRLHVLSGYIDVTPRNNPAARPVRLVAPASVTVTGDSVGLPIRLDDAARQELLSDLHPLLPQHLDTLDALASGEQSRAVSLARLLTGDGAGGAETLDLREVPANLEDGARSVIKAPITPSVQAGGGSGSGGSALPFIWNGPPVPPVNVPGDLYQVQPFSSQSISTDFLRATNSTLAVGGDVLQVKGSLSSSTALPFMSLAGSTLGAQTLTLLRNGTLSLTGTLLDAVNSAANISGAALVEAQANSSLTGASASAFLSFTGGSLSLGGGTNGFGFNSNSTANLAGPLLSGNGTSITGSSDLVTVKAATLTDTTTSPLVSLTGGTLELAGASGFSVSNQGTANLSGGLLSTSGTDVTSTGDFVLARTQGRFVVTGSLAPLVSLAGGNSQIATAGSIFNLIGTATAPDPVSGLTVGTEEPIQHGGGFLDMNAATATTARAVTVDTALLQASAPLLNLRGASGAQLTTRDNAIDLTSKAKVTNTGAFVALDQSRLIVNNAALINVAGGSFLQGGGNLINLANGSTLTINNGVLLSVSGGSIVSINGALIAFSGSPGNMVNVSNALAFVNIGGIPVALTGGALAANVTITGTPIRNPGLGAITPNRALIQVNGARSRVMISGN